MGLVVEASGARDTVEIKVFKLCYVLTSIWCGVLGNRW